MSNDQTFNDRTISEEEFDVMAEDVVANPPTFVPDSHRRRGHPSLGDGPSRVAQARFSRADFDTVAVAARSRGETMSEFLRRSVLDAANKVS